MSETVLVTGGAGYVGAVLVPKLLAAGFGVRVLDLYLYGDDVLRLVRGHPELEEIKGDIRDTELVERSVAGCRHVIHLACISNDPSFELDPSLGRSINFDAFAPLVRASKAAGVSRFIYASTSSVYGISDAPDVTEEHPLKPVTDYSRFKGMCETILLGEDGGDFVPTVIRPATVCGYSPRQRLDLTVNILTTHAVTRGIIKVFGGTQKRPNIHIEDICNVYLELLAAPEAKVRGKTFNAGYQNHTVREIADIVQGVVTEARSGREMRIEVVPTNDVRSYHISSAKIAAELGFRPQHTIEDAVRDLTGALTRGDLSDPLENPLYYNVKLMKNISLT